MSKARPTGSVPLRLLLGGALLVASTGVMASDVASSSSLPRTGAGAWSEVTAPADFLIMAPVRSRGAVASVPDRRAAVLVATPVTVIASPASARRMSARDRCLAARCSDAPMLGVAY